MSEMSAKIAVRFLYCLALAGFVFGLYLNLWTYFGPGATMDRFWFMHMGIFLVFAPAIYLANDLRIPGSRRIRLNLEWSPRWMRVLGRVLFAYAFINFAVTMFISQREGTYSRDGKHALSADGKTWRELDPAEYTHHEAMDVRWFSGLWLVFYFEAATILRAKIEKDKKEKRPPSAVIKEDGV